MEEDIKILEELKNVTVTFITDKERQAIENLIKGYRELEEERNGIYADYQDLGKEKWKADEAIIFLTERLENSISKSKIKEKIEKIIKSNPKQSEDWDGTDYEVTPEESFAIEILEELMEDK